MGGAGAAGVGGGSGIVGALNTGRASVGSGNTSRTTGGGIGGSDGGSLAATSCNLQFEHSLSEARFSRPHRGQIHENMSPSI